MAQLGRCFSCGERFNGDVNALLSKYKKEFDENGIVRYYYHLGDNRIKIVRADSFKTIFKTQIKPNFKNGAEYARIDEYTAV